MSKKRLLSALLGSVVLSAGFTAQAAPDAGETPPKTVTTVIGGTLHFTGKIVNAACAVSASSVDQTIQMGQYAIKNFKEVGSYSGKKTFSILLEDCDTTVATEAATSFYGVSDEKDNTVLAISNIPAGAAGSAAGIGLELRDSNGVIMPPDGSKFSTPRQLINGSNVLRFSARYKSTLKDITPGAADADVTFTMQYQ